MPRLNRCAPLIAAVFSLLCASSPRARAEVIGVDIASRADVENGAPFGEAGAYEVVSGRIRFAVDPANPRNRVIVGLDELAKANQNAVRDLARHAQGRDAASDLSDDILFFADLAILRPKDPAKGNGTLLLDVVNRGNKTVINSFDRAAAGHDDGFLMRRGFTVVWVGWEFDARNGMRIEVPEIAAARCVVHGVLTPNTDLEVAAVFGELAGYMPNDAAATARLSVRDGLLGTPTPIASNRFKVEGKNLVTLKGGFTAGRSYELSYDVARVPVGGLGFAAVRDAVSWLKQAPDANVKVQRALAFGSSQSGRFLRTFLYYGFNADERGRQVFDGVMAHIAGASRLDVNRPMGDADRPRRIRRDVVSVRRRGAARSGDGAAETARSTTRARATSSRKSSTRTPASSTGAAAAPPR